MVSSKRFMVLAVIFQFMIHPKFMCTERGRGYGPFCFPLNFHFTQNYSLKRRPFRPLNWLDNLGEDQPTVLVFGLFLGLFILCHWSIFMPKTLIAVALLQVFKLSSIKQFKCFNSALRLKTFLAIQDPSRFHIHFRNNLLISSKKKRWLGFCRWLHWFHGSSQGEQESQNIKSSNAWTKHISHLFQSPWIPLNNVLQFSV